MHAVGILGCGWLGVPLAHHLMGSGYRVRGSRTSTQGVSILEKEGISGFKVLLEENTSEGVAPFLEDLDYLVIGIPPGRNSHNQGSLLQKVSQLLAWTQSSKIQRLIFLSSISVYGSKGKTFDEECVPEPETDSAKTLLACENLIIAKHTSSVIIRLGGLVGPDRNPITSLQGKTIANPKGKINFVHQKDAVEGISSLIATPKVEGVFNLVSPHHPERATYYSFQAQIRGLAVPEFAQEETINRIIEGTKITQYTSFSYSVDNLLI